MPDLKKVLQEYVATANNPKYNNDYNIINSKFPELEGYDDDVLKEYVATANNRKYNNNFDVINSKFPEFFAKEPEKKKETSLSSVQSDPWASNTPPTLAQSLSAYGEPQKAQASGT